MEFYASLKSIAMHVPSERVKNAEFQQFLDTSDEWIEKRTGIKERRFANDEEKSSDLGVIAAKQAIERAHLTPQDIDLVVVATLSPDFLAMPSTACVLSAKLGIENKPAFDISAACTGFIYLLSVAKAYIESGMCENALIVGAEKTSSVLDFKDRGTCILFGDGAGACVIGRTKRLEESVLDVQISANGNFSNYLYTPRTLKPTPFNTKEEALEPFLRMKGNEVFKLAVKTLLKDVEMILEKNALKPEDVRLFIPHQANFRIIQAVREHLDFKDEQVVLTVHKYGNTSAASIPMAMCEAYEEGRLKKGDLMLLDAFGGGLTWGSALVYFGGN
ncbi:3-oxoacyl-[acyl-carrier-protein] synthase 3 [Helicobacter pylori]|nr:3-oxoacyl-[acyl-carrier-protein] synthase 3 [Helicobacter pylori]